MELLSAKEQKFLLQNLGILIDGFRLLSKEKRYIEVGGLEEDERYFAIHSISNLLPRWAKQESLTTEDEKWLLDFNTSFLEALYIFKRTRQARFKEVKKMEKIFERYIPYKLLLTS
jgi:hypothetical protein